jgi:hypothetical protein
MNFDRIIQDLILKNNSVAIPGLGTLFMQYNPAEFERLTNRILPPVYQLNFKTLIDPDDNSLVNIILDEYEITKERAEAEVKNWVDDILSTIERGNDYLIKEVGSFRKSGSNIDFEADTNSILLAGNLGLEVTKVPIFEIVGEIEKQKKVIIKQTGSNKHIKELIAAAIALLIILSGIVLYRLELLQQGWDNLIGLIGDTTQYKFEKFATNDTLIGRADAKALKRRALLYAEQQNNQESATKEGVSGISPNGVIKYYLIAGSFKTIRNAEKLQRELISKGYTPEILNIADTTFRVSLASYINRRKAVEEFIALTEQDKNFKLWLYSQLISQ